MLQATKERRIIGEVTFIERDALMNDSNTYLFLSSSPLFPLFCFLCLSSLFLFLFSFLYRFFSLSLFSLILLYLPYSSLPGLPWRSIAILPPVKLSTDQRIFCEVLPKGPAHRDQEKYAEGSVTVIIK
jgi:hypothetical protein